MNVDREVERHIADGLPLGEGEARVVAGWWHGGQSSALYAFASSARADKWAMERELAEGARSSRKTHRPGAPVFGHEPPESGDGDGEGSAGQPETDQHARGQVEGERRGACGHETDSHRVNSAADREYPCGAVAVGYGSGERLPDAPDKVLDRYRQGEDFQAPTTRPGEWFGEEPKGGSETVGDQGDQTPRDDDDGGRPPPTGEDNAPLVS